MKLKRIRQDQTFAILVLHHQQWVCLEDVLREMQRFSAVSIQTSAQDMLYFLGDAQRVDQVESFLQQTPPTFRAVESVEKAILPFQPTAYRDFMLSEQHYIDAGRGLVRRFMPKLVKILRLYERLLGTFPGYKPKPLWYKEPIYYMGSHLNFVTEGSPVGFPVYSRALDYELELGFFIVRPLKDATPDEALSAIGGFVVFNDFSARDVQKPEMDSGFGPQKAKHFLNAMSEVVTTATEVLPVVDQLKATVRIDGRLVVETSTAHWHYSLGQALSHASRGEQLHVGEFFGSGTLPGGSGMERNTWLQRGNTVELHIDGIGSLTNHIE